MAQPDTGTNSLVSLPALLRRNAANFGNSAAFREKEFGIWQTWSWSKALDEAENFALGLIELPIIRIKKVQPHSFRKFFTHN